MKATLACFVLACSSLAMAQTETSPFGGPVYTGTASLNVGSSLISAGGGMTRFNAARAFRYMLGPIPAKKEIAKLTHQYGQRRVKRWLGMLTMATNDTIKRVGPKKLTPPWETRNDAVKSLVTAGKDKDGTFYTDFMWDKCFSHDVCLKVMGDIESEFGKSGNSDFHRITNQSMYDLAYLVGFGDTKLAPLH